ncbi:MAG: PAC2 family protein [Acidimicrobiales bacterium]|nr:PAC2 family protein [Acidimicrobiales bacterium]
MSGHDLVEFFDPPDLERTVLVLVLDGWIDAAGAAGEVRSHLLTGDGHTIGRFDTDRLLDHRARRPTLNLVDGVSRGLDWPTIELRLLDHVEGRDVLLLHGAEPDHEWRAFADAVLGLCDRLDVSLVIGLGAYPAAVPHTRPIRLACTAGSADLTDRLEFLTASLEVPAGAQAAIEAAATAAGIEALGLWAQVPHYLSATSFAPATEALLTGLATLAGVKIDLTPVTERALAARTRLDEMVARDPEHVTMLEKLEAIYDDLHDPRSRLPSGEDLAAELERFLRDQ